MQKLKLQNTWNKETKSFDRDKFELRETDGTISGKMQISSKKGDKWLSKPIPFTAFKSKIDFNTIDTIICSKGQIFEAKCNIVVDSFIDKATNKEITYFKLIINEAWNGDKKSIDAHSQAKANGFAPETNHVEDDADDGFPPF
jgi:hypothetical protein